VVKASDLSLSFVSRWIYPQEFDPLLKQLFCRSSWNDDVESSTAFQLFALHTIIFSIFVFAQAWRRNDDQSMSSAQETQATRLNQPNLLPQP
jgi:hypothetical protein